MKAIFSFVMLMSAALCATAQDGHADGDTLSAPPLRGAVVKAGREGVSVVRQQVLRGAELQRMGSYSIADAVRYFSGAQLKDYGGIGGLKTLDVRGMGSEHLAVSYDGIVVGNAQNGIVDLGRYSLATMSAVSLGNGGGGALLRPARTWAAASSLDLVPRRPEFGGRPWNLKAVAGAGSFGTISSEVVWEQKLSPSVSLQTNAAWLVSDGRYKFRYSMDGGYDTTATRRNGDIAVTRGEATVYGQLRDGHWRARAYVYHSRRGLPGAVVRNRLSHIDRQSDTDASAQGVFSKRLGRLTVSGSAKFSYSYLHYLYDSRRDNGAMYVDNRYRQGNAYASVVAAYAFGRRAGVSLSADYALDALRSDIRNFAMPVRNSLYANAAFDLRLGQTAIQANALATYVRNRATNRRGGDNSSLSALTPAVAVRWEPLFLRGTAFRALLKRSCRVPTLNDLYYTFIGNSDLRPEFATQASVGAEWGLERRRGAVRKIAARIDAYSNRVADKIIAVPATNQFRWTMTNFGKVRIRGVEAGTECNLGVGHAFVGVRGSYTWQRAMDCSAPGSPYHKGQIPYVPRHSASLVANAAWKGWGARCSLIHTGRRYDSSANIPANMLPANTIIDFAADRRLEARGFSAVVTAAVGNVANRRYEVVRCYPMPGRNWRFTLTINI